MDTVTEATEESIHDDDSVTDVHVVKGWGAVVVFVKEDNQVRHLTNTSIVISGEFVLVSRLIAPSVRVTVANVPDEDIKRELMRYGKVASTIKQFL
ncbi:fukutin-like [Tachysurus ichikawai]